MSTEQEDAAMLLELQEKITRRIREQIISAIDGVAPLPGTISEEELTAFAMQDRLMRSLVNNPAFVIEMTKRIGQKMNNIY
jgi:hypothetical protein